MDEWLKQMEDSLKALWGISGTFAAKVALLYAYLWWYGLSPSISSGFRDPNHQKALIAQWDSGNRTGLAVRPAADSLHSRVDGSGKPDAKAVDIASNNHDFAGKVAEYLGIGWGGRFSTPDPIHFYEKSAMGHL